MNIFFEEDIQEITRLDFSKHQVISFGKEPEKIDFITHINQVKFEDADTNKIIVEYENLKLPVINLRELVLSKINTGRKKDEADVEELQRIQQNKNNE